MLSRSAALLSLTTAGLLLAGTAPASAATSKPASLTSMDQARNALADVKGVPGAGAASVTISVGVADAVMPCLNPAAKPIKLAGAKAVSRPFFDGSASAGPANFSGFIASAVVFHTLKDEKVGMTKVIAAAKHCPKSGGDSEGTVTRTLSTAYAAGGWQGWRSIDHVTEAADPTDGSPALSERIGTEIIAKGNVVLVVMVLGDESAGSGTVQEKLRKAATTALLKSFAAQQRG